MRSSEVALILRNLGDKIEIDAPVNFEVCALSGGAR